MPHLKRSRTAGSAAWTALAADLKRRLARSESRQDRFIPVDCISHAAILLVKRLCHQTGKPLVPLRSGGLARFSAYLKAPRFMTQRSEHPVFLRALLLAVFCLGAAIRTAGAAAVHVLAAGSLREALGEVGQRYRAATGIEVAADFGPSGLLRQRIEKGEHADLLASADMGNPLTLLNEARATRVVMFTRNTLCGFAPPAVGLTTANFLERLPDPARKLGTSTPKADPGGDYTWAMFHRIDALRPGSYAVLDKKAQQIVGGPASNAPVGGKDPVAAAFGAGRIDIFIGYCSGTKRLRSQMPALQAAAVPRAIAVGPEYGVAVLSGAGPMLQTWRCSCCRPKASRFLPDRPLRRWRCRRLGPEPRLPEPIEVFEWTVMSISISFAFGKFAVGQPVPRNLRNLTNGARHSISSMISVPVWPRATSTGSALALLVKRFNAILLPVATSFFWKPQGMALPAHSGRR